MCFIPAVHLYEKGIIFLPRHPTRMMTEKEFKEVLKRYERDEVNDRERAMVEKWLELTGTDEPNIIVSDETLDEIKRRLAERIEKAKKIQPLYPQWIKVAASIALVIATTVAVWQWQTADTLTAEAKGEMQKIMLADGSIVWLKENSTLTYPDAFDRDTRRVSLMGEALFEVEKDPAHPFIIECGDLSAKVLGTSFNIKTTQTDIEVTVLTGKVSLTSGKHEPVVIAASEKAVYHKAAQEIVKADLPIAESMQVMENTEYNMLFKTTSMKEIAKRIEGKFDVTITMTNERIGNCHVTADFTDQSLNRTLDMLTQILGDTYEIKDKQIKISGEGCD